MKKEPSFAADAEIIQSNDFSVNESILTGESMSVFKDASKEDKFIYKGTTVASGLAIATVISIGNETKLGKIGKSLESIVEENTTRITNQQFCKKDGDYRCHRIFNCLGNQFFSKPQCFG